MTGYAISDFVGHSCRFLQWPDGGRTRKSHPANDGPRQAIKDALTNDSEVQTTLVNYKKNGDMFYNFVTIVPITWDDDPHVVKYWVGFQVDISGMRREATATMAGGAERGTNPASTTPGPRTFPSIAPHPPVSNKLRTILGLKGAQDDQDNEREQLAEFIADNLDGESRGRIVDDP